MYFKDIIAPEDTKVLLHQMYQSNRIAHALFFAGPSGYGGLPLAIAYARMLLSDKKDLSADLKIDKLQHPDLHFSFPSAPTEKIKRATTSIDFLSQWREFLHQYPYGNLFNWLEYIEIENKQVQIGVEEAQHIIKSLQIKSYEGGYKVLIMWMPERLHLAAANKLLKILEEPPEKTVFLLVGEQEESLLPTLGSRMQIIRLKPLFLSQMQTLLQQRHGLSEKQALLISKRSEGQWGKALDLLKQTEESEFEVFFIQWMRNAFMARKKPMALKALIEWSEAVHHWGREHQKQFLDYALYIFRQALLSNYEMEPINFNPLNSEKFNWKAFSKHVQGENIQDIFRDIHRASKDIERNAYAKIVFLDLSIHIIGYLHQKNGSPPR
ncbi:ATP-binding protein [Bacteroidetes bacterium endosymbiont of Geopemphigus sp.]|uniref:DNA polymerase III subunit n=1 Tax=Bacteroidetes bacterium endosymbiont of Geopemphigus sp. TaxID=2047937 RepID=UPI000CD10F67|nr:DNA polymerase III subunit delta' [Bacteroidetes bacterium endosymbiont of Geopemphigus sp.]